MGRGSVDEGKTPPFDLSDPAQSFSRYLQVLVTPSTLGYQDEFDQAANQFQVTIRRTLGGPELFGYSETIRSDTNAPAYPNAWLRLKRVGENFYAFRGADG